MRMMIFRFIFSRRSGMNVWLVHTWVGVGRGRGDAFVGAGAVAAAGGALVAVRGVRVAHGVLGPRAADEARHAARPGAGGLNQRTCARIPQLH